MDEWYWLRVFFAALVLGYMLYAMWPSGEWDDPTDL